MQKKQWLAVAAASVFALGLAGCGGDGTTGGQTADYVTGDEAIAKAEEYSAKLAALDALPKEELAAAFPGISFSLKANVDASVLDGAMPGEIAENGAIAPTAVAGIGLDASLKLSLTETAVCAEANAALNASAKTVETLNPDREIGSGTRVNGDFGLRYRLSLPDMTDYAIVALQTAEKMQTVGAQSVLPYLIGALTQMPTLADFAPSSELGDLGAVMEALWNAQLQEIMKNALSVRVTEGKYEFKIDVTKAFTDELVRSFITASCMEAYPRQAGETEADYLARIDATVAAALGEVDFAAGGAVYAAVSFNGEGIPVSAQVKLTDVTLRVSTNGISLLDLNVGVELGVAAEEIELAPIGLADMQAVYPALTDLSQTPTLESLLSA